MEVKQALEDFYNFSENFEKKSFLLHEKNQFFYKNLKEKVNQNLKKQELIFQKSAQIKKCINDYFLFLEDFKEELKEKAGISKKENLKEKVNFFKLVCPFPDLAFIKKKRTLFEKKLADFKAKILPFYFFYPDEKVKQVEEKIENRFKNELIFKQTNFSLLGGLIDLSALQLNLKKEEAFLLSVLFLIKAKEEKANEEKNFSKDFQVFISVPPIIRQGEKIHPKVFLNTQNPVELYAKLEEKKEKIFIKNNEMLFELDSSKLGKKEFLGSIYYKDEKSEEKSYPFSLAYEVIENSQEENVKNKISPSGALFAQNMNVLYRGVENPLSAPISGLLAKSVKLKASSGKLIFKSPGKWIYCPEKGKEVDFILSGKTYEGKNFSQKISFRIKELPAPKAFLRGEAEPKIPFSSLKNAKLSVKIPGFGFPINILIKSFHLKVAGKATLFCKGNVFSQEVLKALENVSPGETFMIYNIEAFLEKENKMKLKKIAPLKVLITH